ncbi:MAG: phosphatase PAP2 family protein [Muribaculaceae bacterium]|nr:phosphatase PAP2 family protein [Muribaculaceae bacterium]
MKKYFSLLFLMASALLPISAQTAEEVTVIEDSTTTIIDEANEAINIADTGSIEVVDTVSEQTNTGPTLTPAGDGLLWQINKYRYYNGPDFHFLKNTTNDAIKPYKFMDDQTFVGIPVFLAGLLAKREKAAFRQDYNNENTKIRLIKYNFHTEIDNYTQFSGIALTAGLKMAGVEGRSSWPRLFASSLASYAVMAGFVNGIKYTASEMRPDGSTRNSWPSGHTATAFVGATILHKEYGLTRSPWYSIAGYTVATATGVMRVLNNRHWISDVLSGAGIGILSTELAYGICDLLFKEKGLLMNDLSIYPDLRENPSFFSISMGLGLGNKNLVLPEFTFELPEFLLEEGDDPVVHVTDGPLRLQFRSATAVGVEGAWFFNPYVGVGGRLRVKSTPIKGWNLFAKNENASLNDLMTDPTLLNSIDYVDLTIESDHITEFAGDAGVYFNLPLSSRFAIGSKLLVGQSIMDDLDVTGSMSGKLLNLSESDDELFEKTDEDVTYDWDFINVHASNSIKFGTGLSFTYAYKNSFSWRLFCDYDYCKKTYTASYSPFEFFSEVSPDFTFLMAIAGWDMSKPLTSSASKHLHQWVLGGALCVSF